jgi:hypothetical protein
MWSQKYVAVSDVVRSEEVQSIIVEAIVEKVE